MQILFCAGAAGASPMGSTHGLGCSLLTKSPRTRGQAGAGGPWRGNEGEEAKPRKTALMTGCFPCPQPANSHLQQCRAGWGRSGKSRALSRARPSHFPAQPAPAPSGPPASPCQIHLSNLALSTNPVEPSFKLLSGRDRKCG